MEISTINAVVMLNVANLTLPERNAKLHTDEQVTHIMNSIKEFGMNDPIGVWGNKNIIVEGAGRWEACKRLAIESVPCIRLDHLTAEARRAYALAHNLTQAETGFDLETLNLEVSELDFNFGEIGINAVSFEANIAESESHVPQRDVDLSEREMPIFLRQAQAIERGDVFEIDDHRLVCGDATSVADVSKLMDGALATMIMTDPPYNIPVDNIKKYNKPETPYSNFIEGGGELTERDFTLFLGAAVKNLYNFSVDGSIHYIWMDWRHIEQLQTACKVYEKLKNLCVWNKSTAGLGAFYKQKHELCFIYQKKQNGEEICNIDKCVLNENIAVPNGIYMDAHECCFVYKKGRKPNISNISGDAVTGRYRTNVWDYQSQSNFGWTKSQACERVHPTMKPVEMLREAILDCSNVGDIVLDLFGGSGSTMVACNQVRRRCYMIEKDARYVNVILRRMKATFPSVAIRRNGVVESEKWVVDP